MLTDVQERLSQLDPQSERVRLNLVFCIFCKTSPEAMIEPGLWLLNLWQQHAGSALTWAMVGGSASSLSKVNKGTPAKIQKEIRAAASKDVSFFRFQGPQPYGPDFRLLWSLDRDAIEDYYETSNLVEIMVPLPEDDEGWRRCEDLFREVSEKFPYDSGYLAPSLVFCKETEKTSAGEVIVSFALRHRGLDVANNGSTAFSIDRMTRGARWITYLSKDNAEKLDEEALEGRPGQVQVIETSNGLMIKSAPLPEIGDTNRQVGVPGLAFVAEWLRPITFFGEGDLALLFREDPELVENWENRFFEE